jgi:predicted PurR-regulated permease PerM
VPHEPALPLPQRLVRGAGWAAALLLGAGVAYALRFLVLPVALAFLLRYCLQPAVSLLEDRKVSRGSAVGLVFLGLFLVLVGVGVGVWPSLDAWLSEAPQARQEGGQGEASVFEVQLAQRLAAWEAEGRRAYPNVDWTSVMARVNGVLEEQRKHLMETLPALASGAVSHAGSFVLALVLVYFLLMEGFAMHHALVRWVPNRYFETVLLLTHRVDRQVSSYLRGTAAESLLVTVVLALALWAVGMPSPVLFACLYGVLNVVPFVGPIIGTCAGLLFAMVAPEAPHLGVVFAVYTVVHFLDAMLLAPWLMGRTLNLHPLTIIVGLAVGSGLAGILGMLVAIPAIAVGKAVAVTLLDAHRKGQLRRVG